MYLAILAPPRVQRRVATSCSRWAAAELRNPRASRWPHHRNQRHKSNLARLRSLHGEVVDHIIISQGGGNSHPWGLSMSGWFPRFLRSTTIFLGGFFMVPKKPTTSSTHVLQFVELILSLLHYPNPPCIKKTWRSVLESPVTNQNAAPKPQKNLRFSKLPSEVRIYPAGKSSQEAWQLGSSAMRGLAIGVLNVYAPGLGNQHIPPWEKGKSSLKSYLWEGDMLVHKKNNFKATQLEQHENSTTPPNEVRKELAGNQRTIQ